MNYLQECTAKSEWTIANHSKIRFASEEGDALYLVRFEECCVLRAPLAEIDIYSWDVLLNTTYFDPIVITLIGKTYSGSLKNHLDQFITYKYLRR